MPPPSAPESETGAASHKPPPAAWCRHLLRVWQPHNGLFWLMLLFNGLSSSMAWYLHLAQPSGLLRLLFTLLALANAAAGLALLAWLWRKA